MSLAQLPVEKKLEMAIATTEKTVLEQLLFSPEMLVRRALLRNINITSTLVNKLARDVTENVSFIASQHSKCTIVRKFKTPVSKCVKCKVDERHLSCEKCPY
jgi:hypothetical protein